MIKRKKKLIQTVGFWGRRRFKRKVNRLSNEMLQVLTCEDAISVAKNIDLALQSLPEEMRESLIDRLLAVMKGALKDAHKIHR